MTGMDALGSQFDRMPPRQRSADDLARQAAQVRANNAAARARLDPKHLAEIQRETRWERNHWED